MVSTKHLLFKHEVRFKEMMKQGGLLSSRGIIEYYGNRIKMDMKPRGRTTVDALRAAYSIRNNSIAAKELVTCVKECDVCDSEISNQLVELYSKLSIDIHGHPWRSIIEIDKSNLNHVQYSILVKLCEIMGLTIHDC